MSTESKGTESKKVRALRERQRDLKTRWGVALLIARRVDALEARYPDLWEDDNILAQMLELATLDARDRDAAQRDEQVERAARVREAAASPDVDMLDEDDQRFLSILEREEAATPAKYDTVCATHDALWQAARSLGARETAFAARVPLMTTTRGAGGSANVAARLARLPTCVGHMHDSDGRRPRRW